MKENPLYQKIVSFKQKHKISWSKHKTKNFSDLEIAHAISKILNEGNKVKFIKHIDTELNYIEITWK